MGPYGVADCPDSTRQQGHGSRCQQVSPSESPSFSSDSTNLTDLRGKMANSVPRGDSGGRHRRF
jgi:hypothetical protein